ncbi:MAG: PhnD/SsuA/transferrin family substrate-binding protein [Planctomycetota bacterium]|nr:PhnD/SsuA/transferrin family substrate-binding protein [Planctomycetota bacterium]
MSEKIVLGAVAYDPKVVTIWEGFKTWFAEQDLDFDFILYSNYETQVEGHFAGQFNVAWNSPLAWIEAERLAKTRGRSARAIAMRDSDCDLTSLFVTRSDSGIDSLEQLKGKRLGLGAPDSPQATLIPKEHLASQGIHPETDLSVVLFDKLYGKHGDHIGGERDAAQALMAGDIDATCMLDANHLLFCQENVFSTENTRIIGQTASFDHCNFTVLDDIGDSLVNRFTELLLSMSYDDPTVRPLLDLEGLKAWKPGRVSGYKQLSDAVDRFDYLKPWLAKLSER